MQLVIFWIVPVPATTALIHYIAVIAILGALELVRIFGDVI